MGNDKPAWKEFEVLVERLQRAFHPNATVTRNDHLMGTESGRSREIDISIRYKLGTTDLLLVVDCKKRSRKIDLPEMHSFIGLKSDVQAHAGIMICDRGFSKPAARVATRNSIECLTLLDTEKTEWKCRVRVPVCVEEWLLVPTIFRLIRSDGTDQDIASDLEVKLIDAHAGSEMTAAALAHRLWNEHPEKKPGPMCWEIAAGTDSGALVDRLQIGFEAKVQRYVREAFLALVGLTNVADGLTYTSKAKIITMPAPARFHGSDSAIPADEHFDFGVVLQTTAVKTIELERRNIDLQKNSIELTLDSAAKPLSFRLR